MLTSRYQRIMIFGRPGSGKSTLALTLHQRFNLPVHHLDKHFFVAHWQERNYAEFIEIQKAIIENDAWIIDGNNLKSLALRYARADLVLFVNFPRTLCYVRVFKRLFKKNPLIDDRAPHCREVLRFRLLRYMWSYDKRIRPQIAELKTCFPTTVFRELKNDRDLNALITSIQA